jgi:hypothetical protein
MPIDTFKERLSRALHVLKVDLLNGHDFVSTVELLARRFGMDGYEHDAFRRVAIDLDIDKIQLPIPPRLRLRIG